MTEENERLKKLIEDNAANEYKQRHAQPQFEAQIEKVKEQNQLREEILQIKLETLVNEKDEIRAKYDYETIQRKKLHNEIQDLKGQIRVYCRVRPINYRETQINSLSVVTILDKYTLKIKTKKESMIGPSSKDG